MTTFYLIRHAERVGDPEILAGRTPGLGLSDAGHVQAERLAYALGDEPIYQIFSSPLERARETAMPLARKRGLSILDLPAIGEIDFGEWTGRRFSELASDPRWTQFNRERATAQAPGGESLETVQMRFIGAMYLLRENFPKIGIALYSHADPIKLALAHFLGVERAFFDRIEIELGSVSVVEITAEQARVVRHNDRSAIAA